MKKLLLSLLVLSFLYGQNSDMIIYHDSDYLGFYNYSGDKNYDRLVPAGPTANQVTEYGDYVMVINSGTWGAGNNLQIIEKRDLVYLNEYDDVNPLAVGDAVRTVVLGENGNAYTATGFGDNKALITLAQSSALEIINLETGTRELLIDEGIDGNPQGSAAINDTLIAVAIADWFGSGAGEVAVFNTNQMAVTGHFHTHQNTVDLILLPDGNLFVWTWGTWSGADNFGTAEIIDPIEGARLYTDTLRYNGVPGEKISSVYLLSDSTLFYKTFGGFTDLLNFRAMTKDTDIQNTWYASAVISGQTKEGNFLVISDGNTDIVSPDGQVIKSITDFYPGSPNAVISLPAIQVDPYDPAEKNDGLIYTDGNNVNLYDFIGKSNLQSLFTAGETPNQLLVSGRNLFIINSGSYGAGNNLQKVDLGYFKLAAQGNEVNWNETVNRLDLADNGNAWAGAMINDSLMMITLPQTRQLQKVNINRMEIIKTYNDMPGHPQGITPVNDTLVAVSMADWSFVNDYHEGRSIAIFNTAADSIVREIRVHLNAVNIMKLSGGNLFGWSSGSWSGEDNFGSYYILDGSSLEIIFSDSLKENEKINGAFELEKNNLALGISNYGTGNSFYLRLNLTTYETDTLDGGLALRSQLRDKYLLNDTGNGTEILSVRGATVGGITGLTLGAYAPRAIAVLYPDSIFSGMDNGESINPEDFVLEQNYPNPFNPVTTIRFSLPFTADVRLEIYNVLGQRVAVLINEKITAGKHTVKWDASRFSSGLYFARLTSGKRSSVRKMMLVK